MYFSHIHKVLNFAFREPLRYLCVWNQDSSWHRIQLPLAVCKPTHLTCLTKTCASGALCIVGHVKLLNILIGILMVIGKFHDLPISKQENS